MDPNLSPDNDTEHEVAPLVSKEQDFSPDHPIAPVNDASARIEEQQAAEQLGFSAFAPTNPSFNGKTDYGHIIQPLLYPAGGAASPSHAPFTLSTYIWAWKWELLWLALSLATLAAMIILFHSVNGKPVSSFHSKLSLNTLVSAMAVVVLGGLFHALSAAYGQHKWIWYRKPGEFRGFDALDEASRGPSGSAKLLWWTVKAWVGPCLWRRASKWSESFNEKHSDRFRKKFPEPSKHRRRGRLLILWPAILTIIGKGVDPFLQSVINYVGQAVTSASSSGDAQIGRAVRVDLGAVVIGKTGPAEGWDVVPDMGLSSAVLDGFNLPANGSGAASYAEPQVTCSSGNCTFPVFTTAAVCSACNDVSKHISKIKGSNDEPSDIYFMNYSPVNRDWTSYNLSYSHIRNANDAGQSYIEFDGYETTLLTVNATDDYTQTISFQNSETMFITFLIIRVDEDFANNKTIWNESTPIATECALYMCANAYETTVQNGQVTENQVASFANKVNGTLDLIDGTTGDGIFDPSDANPAYGDPALYPNDLQLSIPVAQANAIGKDVETSFNISQPTIYGLQRFMLFWGVGQGRGQMPSDVPTYPLSYGSEGTVGPLNPLPGALWTSTNLTETFENVARLLTNRFRDASAVKQTGTVLQYTVNFQIDYWFLFYPVGILLLGTVYIFFVIFRAFSLQLPPWKESMYPVLAYGFDRETQQYLQGADKHRHPKSRRESLERRPMLFDDDGDDYRLKLV